MYSVDLLLTLNDFIRYDINNKFKGQLNYLFLNSFIYTGNILRPRSVLPPVPVLHLDSSWIYHKSFFKELYKT